MVSSRHLPKTDEYYLRARINISRIGEWESAKREMYGELKGVDVRRFIQLVQSAREIIWSEPGQYIYWTTRPTFMHPPEIKLGSEYELYGTWWAALRYAEGIHAKHLLHDIMLAVSNCDAAINALASRGISQTWLVAKLTKTATPQEAKAAHDAQKRSHELLRRFKVISQELQQAENNRIRLREILKNIDSVQKNLDLANRKKVAIDRFESKHGNALSKAAQRDKDVRDRAKSLKAIIPKTGKCGYCDSTLSSGHLDHIYPVSKGGLSKKENLIWVCERCNLAKGGKPLTQFLREQGLPLDVVINRLLAMGKHV